MNRHEIHEEMLNDIDDSLSKEKGELVYEATKPSAIQFEKAYQKNDEVKSKLDIENLQGEELEQRVNDRTGITRNEATHAWVDVEAEGNGTIYEGDIVETESGIQYEAIETKEIDSEGVVRFECTEPGEIGNVPANQITHMPVTLEGIDSITNPEPARDGFEAESDENLLQRYYERIRTPATSANTYHYLNWAKEVAGVGEARVFPLWDGDNTVKVVIIDADMKPASSELVEEVQEYIDPDGQGLGEGKAPIGAYCTVVSAEGVDIDVSFSVTIEDGYDKTDVVENVSENITEHLKEIAFEQNLVSYAQIGFYVLDSEGVTDYTNLKINGDTENITIEDDEVAILGGVDIV